MAILKNWPASGQNIVAFAFAFSLVWWYERRHNRLIPTTGSAKRKRRKTKGQSESFVERRVHEDASELKARSNLREIGRRQNFEVYSQQDSIKDTNLDLSIGEDNQEYVSDRKRSLAPENNQSKRDPWVNAASTATIAGVEIGGLLYVGKPPVEKGGFRGSSAAFIDPSLPVARLGGDVRGEQLGYWPNYSNISPKNRAAYIDWLASGRSDKSYGVGYLFMFFYGLERRFFIDRPNSDGAEIAAEVARLRNLYSENQSVQRYLGEFLDVAKLSQTGLEEIRPDITAIGWDVSSSLKYAIGARIVRGETLSSEWLLSWFLNHSDRNLRTSADRCRDEFLALFKLRFDSRFPSGLKLNKPRKKLCVEYQAASGEFMARISPTLDGNVVPDISSLHKPIEIAQEIADDVMNDLDKLSRYLGRNKDGRGSIEAHALLPLELWDHFPNDSVSELSLWVRSIIEAGELVPVLDVVEQLAGC